MSPESSDHDQPLTSEELLKDPLYVKQWGKDFHSAAEAVASAMFNLSGEDYTKFYALYCEEATRRQKKYPNYNLFATGPGFLGAGDTHPWTAADFPGDDAILGPNPNSAESKLRAQFPKAFPPDLLAFVPPTEEAVPGELN